MTKIRKYLGWFGFICLFSSTAYAENDNAGLIDKLFTGPKLVKSPDGSRGEVVSDQTQKYYQYKCYIPEKGHDVTGSKWFRLLEWYSDTDHGVGFIQADQQIVEELAQRVAHVIAQSPIDEGFQNLMPDFCQQYKNNAEQQKLQFKDRFDKSDSYKGLYKTASTICYGTKQKSGNNERCKNTTEKNDNPANSGKENLSDDVKNEQKLDPEPEQRNGKSGPLDGSKGIATPQPTFDEKQLKNIEASLVNLQKGVDSLTRDVLPPLKTDIGKINDSLTKLDPEMVYVNQVKSDLDPQKTQLAQAITKLDEINRQLNSYQSALGRLNTTSSFSAEDFIKPYTDSVVALLVVSFLILIYAVTVRHRARQLNTAVDTQKQEAIEYKEKWETLFKKHHELEAFVTSVEQILQTDGMSDMESLTNQLKPLAGKPNDVNPNVILLEFDNKDSYWVKALQSELTRTDGCHRVLYQNLRDKHYHAPNVLHLNFSEFMPAEKIEKLVGKLTSQLSRPVQGEIMSDNDTVTQLKHHLNLTDKSNQELISAISHRNGLIKLFENSTEFLTGWPMQFESLKTLFKQNQDLIEENSKDKATIKQQQDDMLKQSLIHIEGIIANLLGNKYQRKMPSVPHDLADKESIPIIKSVNVLAVQSGMETLSTVMRRQTELLTQLQLVILDEEKDDDFVQLEQSLSMIKSWKALHRVAKSQVVSPEDSDVESFAGAFELYLHEICEIAADFQQFTTKYRPKLALNDLAVVMRQHYQLMESNEEKMHSLVAIADEHKLLVDELHKIDLSLSTAVDNETKDGIQEPELEIDSEPEKDNVDTVELSNLDRLRLLLSKATEGEKAETYLDAIVNRLKALIDEGKLTGHDIPTDVCQKDTLNVLERIYQRLEISDDKQRALKERCDSARKELIAQLDSSAGLGLIKAQTLKGNLGSISAYNLLSDPKNLLKWQRVMSEIAGYCLYVPTLNVLKDLAASMHRFYLAAGNLLAIEGIYAQLPGYGMNELGGKELNINDFNNPMDLYGLDSSQQEYLKAYLLKQTAFNLILLHDMPQQSDTLDELRKLNHMSEYETFIAAHAPDAPPLIVRLKDVRLQSEKDGRGETEYDQI